MPDLLDRLQAALADRYIFERELGHGGMATVYLARDLKHHRLVAVKVLQPEVATTVGAARFLREIEIAAQLAHPHILPLHDSGVAEGYLYYVMPYVEGESLRERMTRERQLSLGDALQLAAEVADALGYAHGRGIVHRDIKPENILLSGEHAVVADFGIARALSAAGADRVTATGLAVGTPAYMSPEQAGGDALVDGRSDLYALGCVVYEMLAGEPPFKGPSAHAVVAQHLAERPPSLRVARRALPRHVVRAVEIALAKRPADRFATAGAFRAALTGADPARRRLRLPRRRNVAVVGSMVASLVLLGLLWRRGQAPRFHEHDWILVGDFEGPRDDPLLGDAVRELTTVELNQSRFLSTMPRQQLNTSMRLADVPETTRVDAQLARELAFRSAVRAVLVGGVRRLGPGSYSIVMHVVDADAGSALLSVAGTTSDSNLIAGIQDLARRIREGLGERRSAIEANLPLNAVATPSFAAYRRYVEGVQLEAKGDAVGSTRALREALALDSGFASAWYVMGWNYLNSRMLDSARLAFAEALRRPDRLGIARRYRVEADAAYTMRYDLPAAIRAYDLYLEHVPRSHAVHNNRGLLLLALGRYEDALAAFTRGVEVHPFGPRQAQIQLLNQVATLIALGRIERARVAARDLTGPFAQGVQMMMAMATDRWAEADSVGRAIAAVPSIPTWLRVQAAAASASGRAAQGAVDAADRALEQAGVGASGEVARWYRRARLLLAVAAGRRVPAGPGVGDTSEGGSITDGLQAAIAGDTAAARQRVRRLGRLPPVDLSRLGSGPALVEAWVAARAEGWAEVLRLIGAAAWHGEHDSSLLDRVGSLSLRWLAAEAYAQLGRLDSAAAYMELVVSPLRMPANEFALRGLTSSFAHRRLAIWYTRMGARDRALSHWRTFLETVRTPDADLALMVGEARRAYEALRRRS